VRRDESLKNIFANRTFTKLFLASFASQLGTTIGNMAFAFYLLDRFSSQPYYATLAELMYSLPTLFVFFIVGVFADRFDRKKIAENSDWIRAGLTVLLMVALYTQVLPLVFTILFFRSAVSKFFQPAETALLQGILTEEQYGQASGLNQMIFGIFMLFGVSLGAITYTLIGIEGAVMIAAISFIVSALFIRMCQISEEVRLPNGRTHWKNINLPLIMRDFKEGMMYIIRYPLLLAIMSGFFIFGFINGGFAVLPVFTMKYKLAPDDYEKFASLFAIFLGIGFLAGSVFGSILIKKLKTYQIIITGILTSAVLIAAMGCTNNIWVYLILVWIAGLVIAPVNIAIGGWMPAIVNPARMGRVSAWIDPIMMLAQSCSLGLIAWLYPAIVSLDSIYYGIGGAVFLVFAIYLATLPRLSQNAITINQSEKTHT
jgi:MFS family permease